MPEEQNSQNKSMLFQEGELKKNWQERKEQKKYHNESHILDILSVKCLCTAQNMWLSSSEEPCAIFTMHEKVTFHPLKSTKITPQTGS